MGVPPVRACPGSKGVPPVRRYQSMPRSVWARETLDPSTPQTLGPFPQMTSANARLLFMKNAYPSSPTAADATSETAQPAHSGGRP